MKPCALLPPLAVLARAAQGLNILMNNDDGFGASNLRELYRLLVAAGHDVWVVAPAADNSGQGGHLAFDPSPTLQQDTQYGLVRAGAPSVGADPADSHIWYYNGTPSACTMVALDYVLPAHARFSTPDLLVAGPNFGNNVGTFAFTGSGTIGATYTAIYRGIPAIAFSGANAAASYTAVARNASNASHRDPATLIAQQAARVVAAFAAAAAAAGTPVLPLGYGLNVNIPPLNASCTSPPMAYSRIGGGSAGMAKLAYNGTTGVIGYAGASPLGYVTPALNVCYNGDCNLAGETADMALCKTSISVFTVDYDAPSNYHTGKIIDTIAAQK